MSTPEVVRPVRRPAELTVVVVLTYLSAVVAVGLGVVVIFARYDDDIVAAGTVLPITLLGAGLVMLGLLIAATAGGVARGDRIARGTLSVLLGLQFVLHVAALPFDIEDLWTQAIAAVVAAASLVVIWTGRAGRWFARQDDARRPDGSAERPRSPRSPAPS